MSAADLSRRTLFTAVCAAMASFFISGSAAAQGSATANLQVTANVANNCTISTQPVAFGAYDPVAANRSTNRDAQGAILLSCTTGTIPSVALNDGQNGTRRMKSGTTDFLTYELYSDTGRAAVWRTSLALAQAPSIAERSIPVYGRIPAAQDVRSGSYTDTVVATVNF